MLLLLKKCDSLVVGASGQACKHYLALGWHVGEVPTVMKSHSHPSFPASSRDSR